MADLTVSAGIDRFMQSSGDLSAASGDEVAYDFSATVNKAAGNYTGIKLNVTETSAPGTSDYLLQLQVGGTNKATIDNAGTVICGVITIGANQNFNSTGSITGFSLSGNGYLAVSASHCGVRSNQFFGFSSGSNLSDPNADTRLYRNSAGNVGLHGVGADAALFIYSDDSDVGANPTNYEALKLTCDTSCNGIISVVGNGLTTPGYIRIDGTSSVRFALGGADKVSVFSTVVSLADVLNISFGTTTGTKLGTATSQKLAFWNATPVVQPTTGVAEAAFVENAGGTAVNVDSTFGGYTLQQVVQALQTIGLLA